MNNMRKVLCFLMAAVMLAGFALPSVAGDNGKKTYSLGMAIVSSPPAAPPYTVTATITNEGNSTINSFRLSVIGLTVVGVNQPATGNATFTGPSVSVKNMHPLKSGESLTVTISVSSCGDGVWSASVWTGSSLNGQSFDLVLAHSNLATSILCGNLASGAEFVVPDSLNPKCVTGERGYYDKDGTIPGGTLPYFVTNTVPTNDQLHFRWPDQTGGDPLATFDYTVCAPGPLPPAGTTQVAWLNLDGSQASTAGTPAYITALDCLAPKILPAPYGTLAAPVALGDMTIRVDTTTPSPFNQILNPGGSVVHATPPFDIVIGTERMTVTSVACGDNDADPEDPLDCSEHEGPDIWTVTRGVGVTAAAPHAAGLVMSTPLPIMLITQGHYQAGHQALMCIADSFPEGGGHATTLIDIGDGWTSDP